MYKPTQQSMILQADYRILPINDAAIDTGIVDQPGPTLRRGIIRRTLPYIVLAAFYLLASSVSAAPQESNNGNHKGWGKGKGNKHPPYAPYSTHNPDLALEELTDNITLGYGRGGRWGDPPRGRPFPPAPPY